MAGKADRAVVHFIQVFGQEKFYTLFSFLFGLGFYIQMRRAEVWGAAFLTRYARRLVALYCLGLVQVLLVGSNQLRVYAALGFLLLLVRRVRPPILVALAVVCMLILPLRSFTSARERERLLSNPQTAPLQIAERILERSEEERWQQQDLRVHSSGSFVEIVAFHAPRVWGPHRTFPSVVPRVVACDGVSAPPARVLRRTTRRVR